MDLSAIVVLVVCWVLFFGFIGWMAVYSRSNDPQKSPADIAVIDFLEVRKKNKQHLKEKVG